MGVLMNEQKLIVVRRKNWENLWSAATNFNVMISTICYLTCEEKLSAEADATDVLKTEFEGSIQS